VKKKYQYDHKYRQFFGDQLVKIWECNPGPDRYRSTKEGMFGEFDEKEYEKKRSKSSSSLLALSTKVIRGTFIDDILKK
jgi:hypothetical protein